MVYKEWYDGYVTKTKVKEVLLDNQVALKIPNTEIMEIFQKSVKNWFSNKVSTSNWGELFTDLWNGDIETLRILISDLLFDTISYHDYKKSFYYAFLTGLVSKSGLL